MIYLGFDTSNYTTSVACCGESERNIRRLLLVKSGQRGLRQSDALFQHVKQLPDLYTELCDDIDIKKAVAVGVSISPRSVEGSYMPVFLAGEGYADVCAASLGVPLYKFSHQDGHIMAGIDSAKAYFLLDRPFISVHLSGGTCEILLTEFIKNRFSVKIIGGTKDISAGQLIDRIGVALGMNFPAGKEMENLAKTADKGIKLPVNANDGYINFSGIETKTLSLIKNEDNAALSLGMFNAIACAVSKAIVFCVEKYDISDVLVAGGVASNSIIKEYMQKNINANVYFASPELSTDNAYGIALLTKICHENKW